VSDTPLTYLTGAWAAGRLRGKVHHFKAGEGLPVHSHPADDNNHITIVLTGRFLCKGRPAIEGQVIKAGDVLDWMTGEPHGFEALEDSSFIQVQK
jgi:quercetin dioxygenase-like cupin family protein